MAGFDDVRGGGEIGLADFQVNDLAALGFEGARLHQHIEGGFDPDPPHPFREFHADFPEIRDAVARLDLDYAVVDGDPVAEDAARYPPARLERDDGDLVGRVLGEGLRRGIDDGFRVNSSDHLIHTLPRIVTTQVAPEPPRFSATPEFGARESGARRPRRASGSTRSQICATPVAPTGWPLDFRPPLVFMGFSPLRAVRPAAAYGPPSPARDEAEVFERDDLGDGEAVVQLAELDFVAAHAGHLGRPFRRPAARPGRW